MDMARTCACLISLSVCKEDSVTFTQLWVSHLDWRLLWLNEGDRCPIMKPGAGLELVFCRKLQGKHYLLPWYLIHHQ